MRRGLPTTYVGYPNGFPALPHGRDLPGVTLLQLEYGSAVGPAADGLPRKPRKCSTSDVRSLNTHNSASNAGTRTNPQPKATSTSNLALEKKEGDHRQSG